MTPLFRNSPHRRWNPLKREWVLVSPHRTQRPWLGQTEARATAPVMSHDPACYLCPGNRRAGGALTPDYAGTYVFENDYAALNLDAVEDVRDGEATGLLRAEVERGICRVLCFDPRHDVTLASMSTESIRRVIDVWTEQAVALGALDAVGYVQIFENRGAMMGASNPHPHGQIWATQHVPNEPLLELEAQAEYLQRMHEPLLQAYLKVEVERRERVVLENDAWVVVVPFWATWPYETLVLPRRQFARFEEMTRPDREGLAEVLKDLTGAYDRVFETPFPYSMGFHPAPSDGQLHPEWTFHAHFYPPLLRSASVRKFMVGFELLGSPQRDITPESAAESLRHCVEKQG